MSRARRAITSAYSKEKNMSIISVCLQLPLPRYAAHVHEGRHGAHYAACRCGLPRNLPMNLGDYMYNIYAMYEQIPDDKAYATPPRRSPVARTHRPGADRLYH